MTCHVEVRGDSPLRVPARRCLRCFTEEPASGAGARPARTHLRSMAVGPGDFYHNASEVSVGRFC
jgi:hypothetical protein